MQRQVLAVLFCTGLGWAPSPTGADDGISAEPGRWRTTTVSRIEMDGAPAMPAQSHTQEECVEDGAFDPEGFLDPQSGCRAENVHVDGNVMTFEMVCPGPTGTLRTHGWAGLDPKLPGSEIGEAIQPLGEAPLAPP